MISKTRVRLIVGLVVALTFTGVLAALVFVAMPVSNADVMKVLVGVLGGSFMTMVTFYFGDSEGKD